MQRARRALCSRCHRAHWLQPPCASKQRCQTRVLSTRPLLVHIMTSAAPLAASAGSPKGSAEVWLHGSPFGTAQHGGRQGSVHGGTSGQPPSAMGKKARSNGSRTSGLVTPGWPLFPTMMSKKHLIQQSLLWSDASSQLSKQDWFLFTMDSDMRASTHEELTVLPVLTRRHQQSLPMTWPSLQCPPEGAEYQAPGINVRPM
mmetsp:Transcript_61429/g.158467  ORF Transcript_61429/g.158467 Transcript_61429/m.158467 type:complete len:201 (-) Transcript_61429:894-1496(-)